MRPCLQFVSLFFILFVNSSCSHKINSEQSYLPPIVQTDSNSQKFNLQLDFMKHHFSGMLVVRRMSENEVRMLFSTYFGLSIFDFSFVGEQFKINSCIDPMKKEKVLKLLENDFKHLFLPKKDIRIKQKSPTFEKRISGKGFAKSVFLLSDFSGSQPECIQIRHPWIRLKIQLDKINENKP